MKAIFTLALIFLSTYYGLSQVLYNEAFESLPTGTISVSTVSYEDNNSPVPSGALQIIQDESGKHFRVGMPCKFYRITNWHLREPGNNVVNLEFDFYTGGLTDYVSRGGIFFTDGEFHSIGFLMHSSTKKIVWPDWSPWEPWYEMELGEGNSSVFLPLNSWVRLKMSYDVILKQARFSGPGFSKVYNFVDDSFSDSLGLLYFLHIGEFQNYYYGYDNIVVTATPSSSLSVGFSETQSEILRLYPNPASDYITVESEAEIINVYIYDVNGKRSDVLLQGNKIDVSQFPAGNYIVGLKTDKGFVSQKIVKK
ncbi:hypothetical protein FEDK69T_12350 [Flavobacterium enshiense DK69]|uniref:Secretion system C-terminal sorting domain-containing protein n=1 Tax=Flavobacterium enshiense DK69 TaxID=1107311 RepID=V6S8S4_9FLAO|nr:T9SS type A sorting domain-containing protein [Flavobacterium enshiense]ESU23088.1 hypothetical protein FEDK69T_12350 [Flavobacterium enshiense DK69]KGO96047.1 hypothetical protein Q767_07225 [Flavobacterium enshiense DK69]